MMQKKKSPYGSKGFTLVEVLAVLVILAIMAAVSIPSMKGFVDDANMKSHLTDARNAYVACQAAATQLAAQTDTPAEDDVISMAVELLGTDLGDDEFTVVLSGSKVESITYQPDNSKDITINADGEVTYED